MKSIKCYERRKLERKLKFCLKTRKYMLSEENPFKNDNYYKGIYDS